MADEGRTGWENERKAHFDEIVLAYDKVRPDYPDALIADLIDYIGAARGGVATEGKDVRPKPVRPLRALEIGAGTGKATARLLGAGMLVDAAELGANMCEYLGGRLRGDPNLRVINSSFEDADLGDSEYDLVAAASAFHWVDAAVGGPKAHRVLKVGGTFALLRYNVLMPGDDPLYERVMAIRWGCCGRHYGYDAGGDGGRGYPRTAVDFGAPSELRRNYGFEDMRSFGFADVRLSVYEDRPAYRADDYITLLETMADYRGLPDPIREEANGQIKDAIDEAGGSIRAGQVFQLYMGRK